MSGGELVERVAAALRNNKASLSNPEAEALARAAIAAMREPTEAMITALLGAESEMGRFGYGHDSQFADRKQFDEGWRAMIDEALK